MVSAIEIGLLVAAVAVVVGSLLLVGRESEEGSRR
jgi:hypothetical protein